jgi:DNA-directed RNA polymerase specialized sigma24 family protein
MRDEQDARSELKERDGQRDLPKHTWLAERFEENRTHLRSVAYRILGSLSEADDAVQDASLRVSRAV